MPDFERIDRELAAIGSVPEAVQPLLDQYGQRDRSLENVDVVLAALREGRDPASGPPGPVVERPSFLPLGWDAERKSEPGMAPAPNPVAAMPPEEITVTTGLPDDMEPASEPPAAPAPAAPAFVESEAPAAIVSAEPEDRAEPIDTQESFPPPPAANPRPHVVSASPEAEPEPESDALAEPMQPHHPSRPPRPDIQALLDTELDPREFPSTNPPPNLSRSSLPPMSLPPPVPRSSLTPSEPAAQEADFELLVDDDDIMEIDEENA